MNVRLEIVVSEQGAITRHSFNIGNFTKEEMQAHPEFANRFEHGKITDFPNNDYVHCWYVISLEDHEREALDQKRNTNP